MKRVYIYKRFERFWHWTQAALIFFLALTGFEVHGTFHILGFEAAAKYHRVASYLLIVLIIFAIFWHFVTGEWKQYLPTTKKLKDQVMYYAVGMFKGEHHPTNKSEVSKLNPLQRLTYLAFKLVLVPLTILSGVIYMFHKHINENDIVETLDIPLGNIAFWHTLGAILLMVFVVIHVYMTTTGHTPTSNIQAMITGYEELENEEDEQNGEAPESTTKNSKN